MDLASESLERRLLNYRWFAPVDLHPLLFLCSRSVFSCLRPVFFTCRGSFLLIYFEKETGALHPEVASQQGVSPSCRTRFFRVGLRPGGVAPCPAAVDTNRTGQINMAQRENDGCYSDVLGGINIALEGGSSESKAMNGPSGFTYRVRALPEASVCIVFLVHIPSNF